MKYLVTGCDGKLGGRIAENMLSRVSPQELIFTCPDPQRIPADKVAQWVKKGVEIRAANYDNPEQMLSAFAGADRMFMISGILIGEKRVKQHCNVIDSALSAGVQHITYCSFVGASDPRYQHVYVTPDHTATEAYIKFLSKKKEFKYNIMRNNLYMENYLTTSVMLALMSGNKWYTTAGEGKGTFIAKDDCAKAATALLLGAGENNKAYNITGRQSVSQRDLCAIVSKASGINIEYCPVGKDEFYKYLDEMGIPRDTDQDFSLSPVPWCGNDMVTNEASIAEGLMDIRSDDFYKLTSSYPKTAEEIIGNYSYIWEKGITNWKDIV
ncbi:NmrA family NAD(P)-binding protein [Klebsiella indica]|uniref:NAD(P)-dependent oxidoreductase n=1 Tax=Klebsiella indica TaxID=2582917 RepID=A0A5R9LKA3_9ENTR|nr:NmrA family NAD(P)-binding protein [Klebsiella indica]TLV20603.1 NAD(P)-dependent oxidoreductase [Klebsiella indica]